MATAELSLDAPNRPTAAGHDLARIAGAALEASDTIVMLLEPHDGVLTIATANPQAARATGYNPNELPGRAFAAFAGPHTDQLALGGVLAAAREHRDHRTQLLLQTKAGEPFWLGCKLIPEPDGHRTVLIGRNISVKLKQEEQDHAAQGLLAKVFVTVDAPVYIIDLQGRFLMTNPAFDRLLGVRPGALAGRPSLERYTPASHALIAATRDKQTATGLDYTIPSTLLHVDGHPIPCRITGVMVQRADLLRFRIITVLVDRAPPAATIAGHIQLVGLSEVRHTMGARWAALKDRAMAIAEQVVRSRLGPRDTLSLTQDEGFVICFADASEADASARAASIGQEVRRRLIGDTETADVAHVFAATAVLAPDTQHLPAAELAAAVRAQVGQRIGAIQATARASLAKALANPSYETEAVHARDRAEPIGCVVRLPDSVDQALEAGMAVLDARETAGLDRDTMLLSLARTCAVERARRDSRQPVFVPLSAEFLFDRRRMESCVHACAAVEERLRQQWVLILPVLPGAMGRLVDGLQRLRPYCRSLGLAAETLDMGELEVRDMGVALVVVDAASCAGAPGWEPRVRQRATSLRAQRCRLMLRNAGAWNATQLLAQGVDLVSIAPG